MVVAVVAAGCVTDREAACDLPTSIRDSFISFRYVIFITFGAQSVVRAMVVEAHCLHYVYMTIDDMSSVWVAELAGGNPGVT